MAHIVISDDTNAYTARSMEIMPLGGTESSVVHLGEALARRGHRLTILTTTAETETYRGVEWRPLESAGALSDVNLHIAVQHPRLLHLVRKPWRKAIWLVWPVNNLRHYKQVPRVWRHHPILVFSSLWQARNYSWVLPRMRPKIVIPLAVEESWRNLPPLERAPPQIAVYGSMPQRGLPWLLPLWQDRILPKLPNAQLHLLGLKAFGQPYAHDMPKLPWLDGISATARAAIHVHPNLPRERQRAVLRGSRVMLYGGHRSEAFCLSVAEAQALGIPAVVRPVTVLPERVRDGTTGFVRNDPSAFAEAAVRLLTDDDLWWKQHHACLAQQQGLSWDQVAERFEWALLSDQAIERMTAAERD